MFMSSDTSNNCDTSAADSHPNVTTGARTKVKDKSGVKMLRRKLRKAYISAQKSQSQVQLQKSRAAQIIAAWKARLAEAEQAMQRLRMSHDLEMKSILSNLLFFEGQLRKEQKQIIEVMQVKDQVITDHKSTIDQLKAENQKLKERLKKTVNPTKSRDVSTSSGLTNGKDLQQQSRFEKYNLRSQANGSNTRTRFRRGRSKSELDLHLMEKLEEVSDEENHVNGRVHSDEHGNAGMHTRTPGSLNRITSYSDENLHQHVEETIITTPTETEVSKDGEANLQDKYDELLRNVAGHFIETPLADRSRSAVGNADIFTEVMDELQKEYGCVELEELRNSVGGTNNTPTVPNRWHNSWIDCPQFLSDSENT